MLLQVIVVLNRCSGSNRSVNFDKWAVAGQTFQFPWLQRETKHWSLVKTQIKFVSSVLLDSVEYKEKELDYSKHLLQCTRNKQQEEIGPEASSWIWRIEKNTSPALPLPCRTQLEQERWCCRRHRPEKRMVAATGGGDLEAWWATSGCCPIDPPDGNLS